MTLMKQPPGNPGRFNYSSDPIVGRIAKWVLDSNLTIQIDRLLELSHRFDLIEAHSTARLIYGSSESLYFISIITMFIFVFIGKSIAEKIVIDPISILYDQNFNIVNRSVVVFALIFCLFSSSMLTHTLVPETVTSGTFRKSGQILVMIPLGSLFYQQALRLVGLMILQVVGRIFTRGKTDVVGR